MTSNQTDLDETKRRVAQAGAVLFRLGLADYMGHASSRLSDSELIVIKPRHSATVRALGELKPELPAKQQVCHGIGYAAMLPRTAKLDSERSYPPRQYGSQCLNPRGQPGEIARHGARIQSLCGRVLRRGEGICSHVPRSYLHDQQAGRQTMAGRYVFTTRQQHAARRIVRPEGTVGGHAPAAGVVPGPAKHPIRDCMESRDVKSRSLGSEIVNH